MALVVVRRTLGLRGTSRALSRERCWHEVRRFTLQVDQSTNICIINICTTRLYLERQHASSGRARRRLSPSEELVDTNNYQHPVAKL